MFRAVVIAVGVPLFVSLCHHSIIAGIIAEAFTLRSLSALLRILLPLQATNFRCTRINVVPKPEEMSSSRRYSKLAFFKAVDDSYIPER